MKGIAGAEKRAWIKIVFAILCAGVFAAALTGCTKKNESRKMSLIEVDGTISIERGKETITGERGMELKSGDVIVTGEKSGARIRIDDDKFLYLGASSNILLTAKGTADNGKTSVFVEKGSVMTEVKRKLNAASSFDVVTPNTSMAIRGTKTLTEVYEDILGAIKTSAAVVEGQVVFSAIQKDQTGTAVIATVPMESLQAFAVTTERKDLLSGEDVKRITEDGKMIDNSAPELADYKELGAVLEAPSFSPEFLTNCVAVLARSRDEDVEEGFVAENITEEELNAAINVLNDVIDGKIELPASVEEYILGNGLPYYEDEEPTTEGVTESVTDPTNETTEDQDPTQDPETVTAPDETTENEQETSHVHDIVHHDGEAATCTSAGFEPYDTCSGCDYTTFKEIPALGHDFGAWQVTTAPYPEYDGGFLAAWHVGEKTRKCSRCNETEKATAYVTPVLRDEIYGAVSALPIDYFTNYGRNPENGNLTLQNYGTEMLWVASPSSPRDHFDWLGIDGAVMEWVEGGTLISSLKPGNTVHVKITVPADSKDVYEDTVVAITLTGAHEHVWSEGYIDPEDPSQMIYYCEICGEARREAAEPMAVGGGE